MPLSREVSVTTPEESALTVCRAVMSAQSPEHERVAPRSTCSSTNDFSSIDPER